MSYTFKINSKYDFNKLKNIIPYNNYKVTQTKKQGKHKITFTVQSQQSQQSQHNTIKEHTINFLQKICPDFLLLRQLIDKDMIEKEHKILREKYKNDDDYIENDDDNIYPSNKSKKLWFPNVQKYNKCKAIKGFMQSKKTWTIIALSLYYYIVYKIPVFIIIENKLSACEQITNRIKEVFHDYMTSINKTDSKHDFEKIFKILDIQRGKKASDKEIKNAMNGKNPHIFISMRSDYDLSPVNNNIEKVNIIRFITIIDESDAIDTHSNSFAQEQLNILKEKSLMIWNVTATVLTTLLKEEIDAGNVIILGKPEDYKDLPTFNFVKLQEKANFCDSINDEPFEKDPNLKPYIKLLARKNTFTVLFWNSQKHPVISLIKIGTTIEPQLKIANYINSKFSNTITTITYNGTGHGTTLRGKNLPNTPITLQDNSKSSYQHGIHTFPDCQIGDIISYLQENGGIDKFPRIAILAGKMADRGITFGTSNYSQCIKNNIIPWHLTEMYYIASESTDQRNLLQTAGRLCGVYKDNIPLTLYSNACDDIIKAYHIQEELIARAKLAVNNQTSSLMKNLIQNIPISKEKCPKRRITPINIPCRLKKVNDDTKFGGWNWKSLGYICPNLSPIKTDHYIKSGNNWRKILVDKLPDADKILYHKFVLTFTKNIGIGNKCEKSRLIQLFDNENLTATINKTWHWHSDKSKYWENADENTHGLLFCLEKNVWIIKLN